jgi:hypothetical protein
MGTDRNGDSPAIWVKPWLTMINLSIAPRRPGLRGDPVLE